MRVIAGVAKGRKLKSIDSSSVRPSGDRLKEALFSSLGPRVAGAKVLDLYAGSGALGIEALSRGAAHATFVEDDLAANKMIAENLTATGMTPHAEVAKMTVERFVQMEHQSYDLVLIDPPYELGLPSEVFQAMRTNDIVAPGGVVVLEASARKLPLSIPEGFVITAQKRYGDSALIYMETA